MTAAPAFDKPAPQLERRTVDWERHGGHGGPKVLPPPGVEWLGRTGRPVGHRYYTRVTTLAKAIDDTSKLMAWKMRGVVVGLGQRPDYVVAAAALTMSKDDRQAADELAEKALDASGPSAALVGTALHTWTERLDRGEPLGYVPEHLRPLIDAYARLTAPLTFYHREVRMICDDLETAGTPDAIGTCSIPDPDGVVEGLRIIDLKSGKVAYPGPMSIQLATYGRSDLYDPATGERTPLEGVNQRWGLIVHTQQDGEVPPGLYWLNLQHGNEGIELCRHVRTWRKVRPQAILLPVAEVTAPDAVGGLKVEDTVVVEQEDGTTADEAPVAAKPPAGPCACGHARSGHNAEGQCQRKAGACPCPGYTATTEAQPDLPPGVIVCGEEPTAEDVQAVAAFAEQLAELGPAPTVLDAMTPEQRAAALEPQGDDYAGYDQEADTVARVRAAVTTRDLDVLWQAEGASWPPDVVAAAGAHYAQLRDQEAMAAPRAALASALRVATDEELRSLWGSFAGTLLWTDEHAAAAEARYRELAEAAA